ncbi:MAG TPA: M64 family metallopeptidase [Candidatus Polarisedimenticolaceae bacterium]|nr:M64 family metallopeptidase [Candidatus Polarisedimenticolaceae bacterium]
MRLGWIALCAVVGTAIHASPRTLVVGVELDRDAMRLVGYTVKPRPFLDPPAEEPRAWSDAPSARIEVTLSGPVGQRYVRSVEIAGLCLDHGPLEPPHVAGDTIRLHRETLLVELPELEGADRVELAYHARERDRLSRRSLGTASLDRGHFTAAGGSARWEDLRLGRLEGGDAPAPSASGAVLWPEQFGDPDIYTIYGNPAEGNRRINVVLVPDGYTYAQKSLMQSHAAALVAYFRSKTPYKEHDPFINYTLVYAYSGQSGTDQCDCSIVVNTAMGTRFPADGDPCGGSANRCLYYGSGCDSSSTPNIVAAELRAPVRDTTIVMVNTSRYGGCGGARAVYAAANGSANEIAVHELGHSLAGLADEYGGSPSCGISAGEVNTSSNGAQGAWSEWIPDLGLPRAGAQYYEQCLYRPRDNCDMRELFQPFCPVCNQRWSLVFYGHPRVQATAPIASVAPASPVSAYVGVPVSFSVQTRLASGPGMTHAYSWTIQRQDDPTPVEVSTAGPTLDWVFGEPESVIVSCTVTADTNFVKPSRNGANQDGAGWFVDVAPLAAPTEVFALTFADGQTLAWEDAAPPDQGWRYNLYRGTLAALPLGDYGSCFQSGLEQPGSVDAAVPPAGAGWTYLVTARNPAGEGPLGASSTGAPRPNGAPCP